MFKNIYFKFNIWQENMRNKSSVVTFQMLKILQGHLKIGGWWFFNPVWLKMLLFKTQPLLIIIKTISHCNMHSLFGGLNIQLNNIPAIEKASKSTTGLQLSVGSWHWYISGSWCRDGVFSSRASKNSIIFFYNLF